MKAKNFLIFGQFRNTFEKLTKIENYRLRQNKLKELEANYQVNKFFYFRDFKVAKYVNKNLFLSMFYHFSKLFQN